MFLEWHSGGNIGNSLIGKVGMNAYILQSSKRIHMQKSKKDGDIKQYLFRQWYEAFTRK